MNRDRIAGTVKNDPQGEAAKRALCRVPDRTPRRAPLAWAYSLVCGFAMACTAATSAFAAPAANPDAQLKQELAVCDSGKSQQSRKDCQREAHAAHAESKRGALNDGRPDLQRNSQQRCEALPASERAACVERMKGAGSVSGSVASGGVLRELTTRTVPPPQAATPATSTTPATPAPQPKP